MTKQERALAVIERLKREYPDAACTLEAREAWKLLVSVRLAAQCTDARVNVVVQDLYAKYPTAEALAAAQEDDVEQIVRPCGLGRSKARDICACMRMLRDVYGGNVPDTMEDLLKLPGVGRKSANLILGDVFGKPAIVTDTHCIRLSNPHRPRGQHQGSETRRDGTVEDHPARGGQRSLPPLRRARPRRVHGPHRSPLRPLLPCRRL